VGISNFLTRPLKITKKGLVRKWLVLGCVFEPKSRGKNGDFLTRKNFEAQNGLVRNFVFLKSSKKSDLTFCITIS